MENVQNAPQEVGFLYRRVGDVHVFSTKGINGLVHVGHHNRKEAFDSVIPALNLHVEEAYHNHAAYKCETTYDDFANKIDIVGGLSNHVVMFTLDASTALCH
ncbi:MAG: hypothetical protein L3J37_00300 [Rhodobacteraceae bacterium]|nr:hypothetical protein [Paracoccaceae bacterium]